MNGEACNLTIHVPGARLLSGQAAPFVGVRPRIGWLVRNLDVMSASTRYRCLHFARALSGHFENSYFTKHRELRAAIDTLDAIIVIKRLDWAIIELALFAQRKGKPIFLDLCDDIAHPLYPSEEEPGMTLAALRAIAPLLSGITVPSAEMAQRIVGYLPAGGANACPCHVIPDIAETAELFMATTRFATGRYPANMASSNREPGLQRPTSDGGQRKRLVWFGNFGALHSNFGIFSLKNWLKVLRNFDREIPLELVVISNNRPVFEALIQGCRFPARYIEWSAARIYHELGQADVALITTGTDDFSTIKSSNRALQALASGVPVIAEKSPSLAELEDVVVSGNRRDCLEVCLRPDRAHEITARLEQARRILDRYTPEALAHSWTGLLERAIGRARLHVGRQRRTDALLVVGPGDEPEEVLAAIKTVNGVPDFTYELLMWSEALEAEPRLAEALHLSRTLPRFHSGKRRDLGAVIEEFDHVFFGDRPSKRGRAIAALAASADAKAHEFREVPSLDLRPVKPAVAPPALGQRPSPGPYPEHANPRGPLDWAFIIHDKARGWILDAICREIGSRQPQPWQVIAHPSPPPPGTKNLFFSHFSLLNSYDTLHPEVLAASKVFLWYTHPRDETAVSIARNLDLFKRTTKVIFTCESNRALWIERGLAPERTTVVLGAADPALFCGHARGGGGVGLSSSFYERKNPDLLLEVVRALPQRQFTLVGRNWNRYARFEQLLNLPNFAYFSAPYRDYPRIYSTFDVFLSLSRLEGGPIPLVEAMMCNAVPVASDTGFAPDLITPGENGFLFGEEAGAAEVADLIERAFALTADVRSTVVRYSWDRFSSQIVELAR